jgi:hypothetical protein
LFAGFDRLLNVYDGATQIFLGVTPEPTAAGITWHVQKDVTGYLPILEGTQTFSTFINNYTSSTDTGIPDVTAKLLVYRAGGGYAPAHTASLASPALAGDATNETGPASPAASPGVPSDIVPMDIPSYRVGLTPFAGLLSGSGTHTISLTVVNNNGYWLAGGDLMLTAGGAPVTGSVSSDTLSFPNSSSTTSVSPISGSTGTTVASESASDSYAISGTVTQGGLTYTDTLNQALQYGNDQTNVQPACTSTCYQWVHQETTSTASETITGPGVHIDRTDKSSFTIDAPNGYQQNSSGSDFLLPATVAQQLTDVAAQHGYETTLSESIIGYGALEENSSGAPILNGETTGTVTQVEDGGTYVRTVTTRGGQIAQDVTS